MKSIFKFTPGFTLVELITSMAIVGVMSLMIGAVYVAHFKVFTKQNQDIDAITQNTIAIDDITNNIKEASRVFYCFGDPSNYCGSPPGGASSTYPDSDLLVLYFSPIDATGSPVDNGVTGPYPNSFDMIVYYLDPPSSTPTNLKKKIITYTNDPTQFRSARVNCPLDPTGQIVTCSNEDILASNVTSITFQYLDSNKNLVSPPINGTNRALVTDIVVTLSIKAYAPKAGQTNDIVTTRQAFLRNK